jgi:hypothetical protein
MPTEPKPVIRYEDAAELRAGLSGWCCKRCGRYWGADEHMARWCCATELPCKECGGRNPNKGYTCCGACRRRRDDERWAKLERVDWDGESPLCEYDGDRCYFDADAVLEMIEDRIAEGGTLEDIRLVVCEPSTPRHFEMADFLGDDLPEDFDAGKDFAEIDEVVNDWIRARTPFSWHPGKKAVSVDSLPRPDEHQEAPPDAR